MNAAELFRAAAIALGLRPQDAWALSLRDLFLLLPTSVRDAPSRAELEALMRRYPDTRSRHDR